MEALPGTTLRVHPLCLGGNVLGWTADEQNSHAVLDRYVEGGGNFIDTADMYSVWVDAHQGGESETVLGAWMKERSNRDSLVVATKVAKLPTRRGLSPANIIAACDDSLRRLQTDHIDLYYAHEDDPSVPVADVLGAFGTLVEQGKVRYIGASNFTAARVSESIQVATKHDLPRYVAVQPQYSLLHRDELEGPLADACSRARISVFPYWALASGFLTGKYRQGPVDSPRAEGISRYADKPEASAVLEALSTIAAKRAVSIAAVALAYCRAHPLIPSVIASARNIEQLDELMPMAELDLTEYERRQLDQASR